MLEFSMVAPLLVLMVMATYDLGNALNQYLALSRVVYEGARYAATLPGLEVYSTSGTNPNTPNHNKIRDRVVDLLQRAGFEPSTTTVETANVSNTWVTVTVTKQYEPMFKFLATTNIRVHASGPFLSLAP